MSNEKGQRFWKKVVVCQNANMDFIRTHIGQSIDCDEYQEQMCINRIGKDMQDKQSLKFCRLPEYSFPDGVELFDVHEPQKHGIYPVLVHNNWIVGAQAKIQRQQRWGF